MSLEQAIKDNTVAIEAMTAIMQAAKGEAKTSSVKTETGKEAGVKEEILVEDKKPTTKKSPRKSGKKEVTLKDVVELATEYLTVSQGDEAGLDKRRTKIKELTKFFDVDRISHIKESQFVEAHRHIRELLDDEHRLEDKSLTDRHSLV